MNIRKLNQQTSYAVILNLQSLLQLTIGQTGKGENQARIKL